MRCLRPLLRPLALAVRVQRLVLRVDPVVRVEGLLKHVLHVRLVVVDDHAVRACFRCLLVQRVQVQRHGAHGARRVLPRVVDRRGRKSLPQGRVWPRPVVALPPLRLLPVQPCLEQDGEDKLLPHRVQRVAPLLNLVHGGCALLLAAGGLRPGLLEQPSGLGQRDLLLLLIWPSGRGPRARLGRCRLLVLSHAGRRQRPRRRPPGLLVLASLQPWAGPPHVRPPTKRPNQDDNQGDQGHSNPEDFLLPRGACSIKLIVRRQGCRLSGKWGGTEPFGDLCCAVGVSGGV